MKRVFDPVPHSRIKTNNTRGMCHHSESQTFQPLNIAKKYLCSESANNTNKFGVRKPKKKLHSMGVIQCYMYACHVVLVSEIAIRKNKFSE